MSDHAFCRASLAAAMRRVRERYTSEQIKKTWVWSDGRKYWEFHGPNGEYDYNLRMADCAWSAKAEGWDRLLEREGENDEARRPR